MRNYGKILVMDDCAEIRMLMADLLAEEGYTVRCYQRVTAESIQRARANLVILELLPGNADRLLRLLGQLRRRESTRDLPILVSSTDPHLLEDLAAQLRYLNCGLLSKPFEINQLLSLIAQNIDGRPAELERGG